MIVYGRFDLRSVVHLPKHSFHSHCFPYCARGFPLYGFHRFHRMPRPGDLDAANPEHRAPRWSLDN